MKIPFSPPDIGDNEIKEVINTLESGWITTGPRVKAFEKRIKDYVGADGCVCLNSQTACAEMTLRLLGIGPGDEVITTAYTYTATAAVINHVGAKIVLIDTVPNGYEMDYDLLEKAITEKTKVIIPVDLGGVPCNYRRLYSIVDEKRHLFKPANDIQAAFNRIIIMSDSAHALGASYYGTMIGAVADFSNFSFHAVKNLTTAEGGAVTWKKIPGIDNDYIYTQYQLLSLHGQSKDALAKINGTWEYDVLGTYYKCNMTDISAAIGLK
jgi:dTDP-4-amino-4,6-dideoxygalactose transaminase